MTRTFLIFATILCSGPALAESGLTSSISAVNLSSGYNGPIIGVRTVGSPRNDDRIRLAQNKSNNNSNSNSNSSSSIGIYVDFGKISDLIGKANTQKSGKNKTKTSKKKRRNSSGGKGKTTAKSTANTDMDTDSLRYWIAEFDAQLDAERDAQREAERDLKERVAELEATTARNRNRYWIAKSDAQRDAERDAERYAELDAEFDAQLDAERDAQREAEREAELDAQSDAQRDAERDLKEQVAELEATRARKRKENRRVSFTLSGRAHQQKMFWNPKNLSPPISGFWSSGWDTGENFYPLDGEFIYVNPESEPDRTKGEDKVRGESIPTSSGGEEITAEQVKIYCRELDSVPTCTKSPAIKGSPEKWILNVGIRRF